MWAASRSWKSKETDSSLEPPHLDFSPVKPPEESDKKMGVV